MPSFRIVARKNTEVVLADNGRFYFVDQDGTVLESISADAQGSVDIIKDLNVGEDLSVVNDATVGNDLTVTGNLYVEGDRVIARTEIVTVDDNILTLNANVTAGAPLEEVGIEALRGNETRARVIWDESQDLWTAGVSGAEDIIVLKGTADADYVNVTGDTMTGALTAAGLVNSNLAGNANEIVIVDVNGKLLNSGDTLDSLVDNVSAGLQTIYDDRYVNLTGDTMTGALTVASTFTLDDSGNGINVDMDKDGLVWDVDTVPPGSYSIDADIKVRDAGFNIQYNSSSSDIITTDAIMTTSLYSQAVSFSQQSTSYAGSGALDINMSTPYSRGLWEMYAAIETSGISYIKYIIQYDTTNEWRMVSVENESWDASTFTIETSSGVITHNSPGASTDYYLMVQGKYP